MYSFSYILTNKTANIFSNHFSSSNCPKNHYDVLNLPRTCSAKDIKESFIKLSKENHPDLNKDKDAHAKFLAINESYKVLSNVTSRSNYDLGLIPNIHQTNGPNPQVYNKSCGNDYWSDPTFYANRDKSKDKGYSKKPYYGIKGQEKVSNLKIVAVCLALASFVVGLQVLAIAKSVTFQRDELLRKSNETQESLNALKKAVELNGNHAQLELLKIKFEEQEKQNKKRI